MIWFLAALVGGYLALVAGLYVGQRGLMYHPSGETPSPRAVGLGGFEIVRPDSGDGLDLYAWWHPPDGPARPTILYFHGNAGNLDDRAGRAAFFAAQGYGVLLTTYRYNAGIGGSPSEPALIADGYAHLRWLAARGVASDRVVLYGESLGSGIACALAAAGEGAAVVVEGGFDSAATVAQSAYPFVPARWLLKDRFDNAARLSTADPRSVPPILVVHGARDQVIAPRFAEALFEAAPEPKRYHLLEEGGHTDLYEHGMGMLVTGFLDEFVMSK